MTREAGTISGALDITLDPDGYGLVRYRETEQWYTIGNLDDTTPRRWLTCAELAEAIAKVSGTRDAAGNTVPFES
ncbi:MULTISPECIES: hypothetical protein [Nocardia]|uniref:hypothetical protein n=1 Tax=Nocardia TaxID=1817 RepID=UPI0018940C27|nr:MULTISPECIES: hypothetical protein [Nocardia]MBF6351541.1 hypothetical protein [Nocardia flavorosea]